jgi:hypothetical protein
MLSEPAGPSTRIQSADVAVPAQAPDLTNPDNRTRAGRGSSRRGHSAAASRARPDLPLVSGLSHRPGLARRRDDPGPSPPRNAAPTDLGGRRAPDRPNGQRWRGPGPAGSRERRRLGSLGMCERAVIGWVSASRADHRQQPVERTVGPNGDVRAQPGSRFAPPDAGRSRRTTRRASRRLRSTRSLNGARNAMPALLTDWMMQTTAYYTRGQYIRRRHRTGRACLRHPAGVS